MTSPDHRLPARENSHLFPPLTPAVKESICDVARQLSQVGTLVEEINRQSAAATAISSPTMEDLEKGIVQLGKDVEEIKSAQTKHIDKLKNVVKRDMKGIITKATEAEVDRMIKEGVESEAKTIVGQWGLSNETKGFVENLKTVIQQNDVLIRDARIQLENSQSRNHNSVLDEDTDFKADLAKIKLPDGDVGNGFPRSLEDLFSYDEKQVIQLLDEYSLEPLQTHTENLNRFLAFIGMRLRIPAQPLLSMDNPPAYTPPNIFTSMESEQDPVGQKQAGIGLSTPIALNPRPRQAASIHTLGPVDPIPPAQLFLK